MMVSYHDLSVLEALGYYVEVAAADVCEYDKVGINTADLFESLLAQIFYNSQMNNSVQTFTASKAIAPAVRPSASKCVTVRIVDSLEAASLIIDAVSSAVRCSSSRGSLRLVE